MPSKPSCLSQQNHVRVLEGGGFAFRIYHLCDTFSPHTKTIVMESPNTQTGEETSDACSWSKPLRQDTGSEQVSVVDHYIDDPNADIPDVSQSDVSVISSGPSDTAKDSSSTTRAYIDESASRILRTNKKKTSKHVSFFMVEISYHNIILGDHPDCSPGGPPIQIDWKACAKQIVQLDHFEKWREGHRRHGEQLAIGPLHRHVLVKKTGMYKNEDIYDRMEEMEKISRQRERSVAGYKWRKRLLSW